MLIPSLASGEKRMRYRGLAYIIRASCLDAVTSDERQFAGLSTETIAGRTRVSLRGVSMRLKQLPADT